MDEVVMRYNEWHKGWLDLLCRIARKEVTCFEDNSVGYADQIVTMNCRRHIMLWIYQHMVRYKNVEPIEKLETEIKQKMWDFVKEICAGKTNDIKRMIEIAKVFYVIEYFINEQTP